MDIMHRIYSELCNDLNLDLLFLVSLKSNTWIHFDDYVYKKAEEAGLSRDFAEEVLGWTKSYFLRRYQDREIEDGVG